MYTLLLCMQFVGPFEIPEERLMSFLETIHTPTTATFLSFSGSRDEVNTLLFANRVRLEAVADSTTGITLSGLATPTAANRPVRASQVRSSGFRAVMTLDLIGNRAPSHRPRP